MPTRAAATVLITMHPGEPPLCAEVAADWPARLVGLLNREQLADRDGLLLDRCASVHTLFMSFPIDVIFLTADYRALRIVASVPPWRAVFGPPGTTRVLELAAGAAARRGWGVGAQLRVQPGP